MDMIPSGAQFSAGRVTNPGQSQEFRQSLYDFTLYAGAGQTQMQFFQNPIGQGKTTALGVTAGTPKTRADTNMTASGQLPNGLSMLVETVELYFWPGSVSTTDTFTIDTISFFNATASATPTAQVDDASAFYQGGYLNWSILGSTILEEAPLLRFPPKCHLKLNAAVASNSATTSEVGVANAYAEGREYRLYDETTGNPGITLQSLMSFSISLNWPAVVAMTSGFNARVGCILDGKQARASI